MLDQGGTTVYKPADSTQGLTELIVEQEDKGSDDEELRFHGVYYTRVSGECKDNLGIISGPPKGVDNSSEEGAHAEAGDDEEEGVVVPLSEVAIFHGYIVTCGAPAVKPYQPKIFSMAMQVRMVTG